MSDQLRARWPGCTIRSFTANPIASEIGEVCSLYPFSRTSLKSIVLFWRACSTSDCLVGFWALQDRHSTWYSIKNLIPRWLFFVVIPRFKRIPLNFINVDAAELNTAVGVAVGKHAARRIDYLAVRNKGSYSTFVSLGRTPNRIACDIGFLHDVGPADDNQLKKRLLVNLRPLSNGSAATNSLIDAIDTFVSSWDHGQVYFLAMRSNDIDAGKTFIKRHNISGDRILSPASPEDAISIIREFSCVIAMRLHVQVLSYLCRVPVFTIGYHAKNMDVAEHMQVPAYCAPAESPNLIRKRLDIFAADIRAGSAAVTTNALDQARTLATSVFDDIQVSRSTKE